MSFSTREKVYRVSNPEVLKSKSKSKSYYSGTFGRLFLYIKFAFQDYCKRKCLFCLGVMTIVICIVATMISQSVISITPIIFYNSAVNYTGDRDLVIDPQYTQ